MDLRFSVLLLLMIPLALPANAQSGGSSAEPAEAVVSDSDGDVVGVLTAGGEIPAPPTGIEHVDLLGLRVEESEGAFTTWLDLAGRPDDSSVQARYAWGFTHKDTEFRITWDPFMASQDSLRNDGQAVLERRPAGGIEWRGTALTPAELVEDSVQVALNKTWLTDETGTLPLPGRSLEAFWATAMEWDSGTTLVSAAPGPGAVVEWHDRMPDDGPAGEFPVLLGASDDGTIRLTTPQPFRASNGEETTYVYEVFATNLADQTRTFAFALDAVPEIWTVSLPVAAAEIGPGGVQKIPVVVATPFNHEHGVLVNFTVTADDLEYGESLATLQLGVKYLTVPQPSGHHPQVWVHTADTDDGGLDTLAKGIGTDPYLNTLADDDVDTGEAISARPEMTGSTSYEWCVPLSGGLQLGLDVDADGPGRFQGRIASESVPLDGEVTVKVLVTDVTDDERFSPDQPCTSAPALAIVKGAPVPVSVGTGSGADLDIPLVPAPSGAIEPGQRAMYLHLLYELERPLLMRNVDAPFLESGATFRLPLLEYQAEPPELPLGEGPEVHLVGESRLTRNPGDVALFEFELDAHDPEVEVLGTRTEWVDLYGPTAGRLAVAVSVPESAPASAVASLVLRVQEPGQPEVSLTPIVVTVDPEGDHPSDAEALGAWQDAHQTTPGVPVVIALGALAAVAGRLRRRH